MTEDSTLMLQAGDPLHLRLLRLIGPLRHSYRAHWEVPENFDLFKALGRPWGTQAGYSEVSAIYRSDSGEVIYVQSHYKRLEIEAFAFSPESAYEMVELVRQQTAAELLR